jgi:hypothetical protein
MGTQRRVGYTELQIQIIEILKIFRVEIPTKDEKAKITVVIRKNR